MARTTNKALKNLLVDFLMGKRDPAIVCMHMSRDELQRLDRVARQEGYVRRRSEVTDTELNEIPEDSNH